MTPNSAVHSDALTRAAASRAAIASSAITATMSAPTMPSSNSAQASASSTTWITAKVAGCAKRSARAGRLRWWRKRSETRRIQTAQRSFWSGHCLKRNTSTGAPLRVKTPENPRQCLSFVSPASLPSNPWRDRNEFWASWPPLASGHRIAKLVP